MTRYIADSIDFAAYEQESEFKAHVRRPSVFAEDLDAEFEPPSTRRQPSMTSTKLAGCIEFRPSEVTIWAGFNGHRKSMFAGQVALDLMAQGQRVLVVSLEMLPRRTLYRMCRQATAHNLPSPERRAEFLRWADGKLWLFDHVGRLSPARCLALLRYFAAELKGTHVFIDSMMKVCQSEESLDEQKALIGDLCAVAEETGMHLHLVAHCKKPGSDGETRPPTKYDIKGSGAISDQSHNIITVWMNKAKRTEREKPAHLQAPEVLERPDHAITVEKQRNGDYEGRLSLWFDDRSLRFVDSEIAAVDPYRMEAA